MHFHSEEETFKEKEVVTTEDPQEQSFFKKYVKFYILIFQQNFEIFDLVLVYNDWRCSVFHGFKH